ncbi:NHLP bacteriocin system secretion protein [Desulfitobacterium sp. AusDCA]|uniref:NHLP bacteriocin system secretion protein n=1 Tax=Desulfitobacterium sp. AusDCA TaxID=3240383 RepID=UPI003DA76ACF
MSQSIFREVSLKRLSSPEQLDQLINVTSPRAWLALIAISLLLISAIVWGLFGSIPTKIEGQGILLNNGGVFTLKHHTSGRVTNVRFKIGEIVKKGDVIARIEVPELVEKINSLQNTQREMELKQADKTPEYKALEQQLLDLREELDYKSQIISNIGGRILDLNIEEGSIIQPGENLATLEQQDETIKMEAVIYVPAEQAGEILPGMEVQISPTIVNKEEYGYMLGRVNSVSKYPATTQSMMKTLGNENLVALLSGKGAPLMVKIDLIPDGSTKSGYQWSSPAGPPITINSGTLIQGDIVIKTEKPLGKIIPLLSK